VTRGVVDETRGVKKLKMTTTDQRERLTTSISATQPLASPGRQLSSESGMFENPFREGGKLSRDAEVIIDALKTGKLSVISNQGPDEADRSKEDSEEQLESNGDLNGGSSLLVEPTERTRVEAKANGEVDVHRGLVINSKQAAVERVMIPENKKQKCACCVLQ